MTLEELTARVVKKSIRSAACIDDEYLSPYEEIKPGLLKDKPAELYRNFRKNANCDLDIYHYESFDKWQEDKNYVLNSKDLLILDWELDRELPIKYENTIKILEEGLSNPFIHFIIIHTHTNDSNSIYQNLLTNFLLNSKRFDLCFYDLLLKHLVDLIQKVKEREEEFDKDEFDEVVEEFSKEIYNVLNGFTVSLNAREKIIIDFNKLINKIFKIENGEEIISRTIKYGGLERHEFFLFFEMIGTLREQSRLILNKEKEYSVKEIFDQDSPTLFINNTFITIFAKENSAASNLRKVAVNEVFTSFTNCIIKLPNNSLSAVIALEFKDVYRQNLALFGKGLAGIDERALAFHLNGYKTITEQYEYLLKIWNNQVSILTFTNSDIEYLPQKEHFEIHKNVNPQEIQKELAEFISNIMISPQLPNTNREIQLGDIFKAEKPLRMISKNESEDLSNEYLLCITPACDCSHPEKINNNYSFLYGRVIKISTALQKSETDYYTFFLDKVIEWSKNPFTLFIENNKLNSIKNNSIRYNDRSFKIDYIATMKEIFTQRVANNAFSNNIRIGVDLPHVKKQK